VKRLIKILGAVLTATLLSAGVAAAASLNFSAGKLGAGSVAVNGCTSSSLTATRNVDNNGNVTQVNILSVPQACAAETIAVTLEDGTHTSLASATAVVGACTGGCTVTIPIPSTVVAANLSAYAVSLSQ
jgi:hypothetical protein